MPITLQELNARATAFQQSQNELHHALNTYKGNTQGRLDEAPQNPLQTHLPSSTLFRGLVRSSLKIEQANALTQKFHNYRQDSIQLKAAFQDIGSIPEELDVAMNELLSSIPSDEDFRVIKNNLDEIELDADVLRAMNRVQYPEVLREYQDTVNSLVQCVENSEQSTRAWLDDYQGRIDAIDPLSSNFNVLSASFAARHELALTQTFVEHFENGLKLEKEVRDQKVVIESVYSMSSPGLPENPARFNFESKRGTLVSARQQCQQLESLIAYLSAQGASQSAALAAQSPVIQSPVIQSPVIQSPVIQSPVIQSPVIQSPVAQSPAVQVPVAQVPVLQSATPVARPSLTDRFSRLSMTKKVLTGIALALPAAAGLAVVGTALATALAVRKVVSLPVSWPMLLAKVAGHQFDANRLRDNKILSALLGPVVVDALTSTGKNHAAFILCVEMVTVGAAILTSGTASFALGLSTLLVAELGVIGTIAAELKGAYASLNNQYAGQTPANFPVV
ncbi:MAG: hypothetical protein QE278_05410 [Limnobacter sp.]|nr:hypothetical protein [Limnobacter sp.]